MDWDEEIEKERKRSESYLSDITRKWSIYFDEGVESLRYEVQLQVQNNAEIKEALEHYGVAEVRFQSVAEAIEAKVLQVQGHKSEFSPEMVELVTGILNQTQEYKSIIPHKYCVGPPAYETVKAVATDPAAAKVRSKSPNLPYSPSVIYGANPTGSKTNVKWSPRSASPVVRGPSRPPSPMAAVNRSVQPVSARSGRSSRPVSPMAVMTGVTRSKSPNVPPLPVAPVATRSRSPNILPPSVVSSKSPNNPSGPLVAVRAKSPNETQLPVAPRSKSPNVTQRTAVVTKSPNEQSPLVAVRSKSPNEQSPLVAVRSKSSNEQSPLVAVRSKSSNVTPRASTFTVSPSKKSVSPTLISLKK